jgi:hypothetical protein
MFSILPPAIQSAGDAFIWFTSILAGVGILLGLWNFIGSLLVSNHTRALLGDWFMYGFFQTVSGHEFYKETVTIKRQFLLPWRLKIASTPVSKSESTVYKGTVISDPPFIYTTNFDPIYHDRTFEIFRRVMDKNHDAKTFVGIHLGRTYEETIHSACAVLMTRSELDPTASKLKIADEEIEKKRFLEIIRPHFKIDSDTLQLMLS